MRKLILCGVATALTVTLASHAVAEEVGGSNEYVVYVESLELRAEPTDDAEELKVQKRGTRTENLREVVTAVDRRRRSGRK